MVRLVRLRTIGYTDAVVDLLLLWPNLQVENAVTGRKPQQSASRQPRAP
jgi:hypothetical protein